MYIPEGSMRLPAFLALRCLGGGGAGEVLPLLAPNLAAAMVPNSIGASPTEHGHVIKKSIALVDMFRVKLLCPTARSCWHPSTVLALLHNKSMCNILHCCTIKACEYILLTFIDVIHGIICVIEDNVMSRHAFATAGTLTLAA